MKFDSNLAWKDASAAIAANREVLLAMAGVFFLLPSLASALLLPAPEVKPDMANDQAMELMSAYYVAQMPWIALMALVQGIGTLAMLTLFTDRSRPTVGQAIRSGVGSIVPYVAAQLLLGMGVGIVGGALLAIAAVTGVKALTAIALIAVAVMVAYAMIKGSLSAPVVAVEGERNPLRALQRSWRLTRGNSARIGVFYLLVGLAFLAVTIIIMGLAGLVLALIAGAETTRVASAVVSSGLGALMTLYFVGLVAAIHRQLAGPSPEVASAPFE